MALQMLGRSVRVVTQRSRHVGYRFASTTTVPLSDQHPFTNEHLEMRQSLRKLIEKDINPYVDEWEAKECCPAHILFKKLGDGGFLGATYPMEFGGLGLDYSFNIAIAEELGNIKACGVTLAIGIQVDMATPALSRFGSDELRKTFLAPSIAGDMVACLGVSEAGAGSDVASIKTTAVPNRGTDDYIINGSKMWTTSGMQADWMCLLANTSEGAPHRNKSLICLPMDASGVTKTKIHKIGHHCSDTAQVFFDNVKVPKKYLIGEEGKGFTYQMLQFQQERLWIAATVLLGMDNAIAETIEYTRERKAFGKSILDNQVVHFKLAELSTEVEALRSLVYRATGLYVLGHDMTRLASMAKLKAGRLCREVTDSCLQYWGGMGYTQEVWISRAFRDLRLGSIGGGTDEVMLDIICKLSGTQPKR